MSYGGGGGYPRKKSKKKPLRFSSDAYKALRLINEERNPDAWGVYKQRFKEHFEFIGNFDNHYGIFNGCGKGIPFDGESSCC